MDDRVKTVVTLVHGTWARKARWVKPGSRIYEQVIEKIPQPAVVNSFIWSGSNSPRAREKASADLAGDLAYQLNSFPDAKHFIIGHSHGGNVALKAVEKASLFNRLHVVCLSTPFLNVKRRYIFNKEADKLIFLFACFTLANLGAYVLLRRFGAVDSIFQYFSADRANNPMDGIYLLYTGMALFITSYSYR